MRRTVLISGWFDDSEYGLLIEAIHKVEEGHKDELYQIWHVAPLQSRQEAEEFIAQYFPKGGEN